MTRLDRYDDVFDKKTEVSEANKTSFIIKPITDFPQLAFYKAMSSLLMSLLQVDALRMFSWTEAKRS